MVLYYIQETRPSLGPVNTIAAGGYCWRDKQLCEKYFHDRIKHKGVTRKIKSVDTNNLQNIIQTLIDFNSKCFVVTSNAIHSTIKDKDGIIHFKNNGLWFREDDPIKEDDVFFQKAHYKSIFSEDLFISDEEGKGRLPLNFTYINQRMDTILKKCGWAKLNDRTYIRSTQPCPTVTLMRGSYGDETHWQTNDHFYPHILKRETIYVPKNLVKVIKF